MMEQEDLDQIQSMIDASIEKAKQDLMLLLPEVSANLYMRTVAKMRVIDKFKTEHKELIPHLDVVKFEMERIEADNPGKSYDEILKEALPFVNDKVKKIGKLDVSKAQKPTDLKVKSDLGEL